MAITPYDSAAQQQAINQMYDAQKQTQLSQLENAYNQQRSSYEQAAAQIAPTYQAQANDLAVQYERNKRNLNEQAAARGLNTGTASQQQLALNQVWQRNYGALKGQQAQAETAAQQKMTDLEAAYQQQVAQAIANNDYDRAKALYDEAQIAYQRQMQEDQIAYQRQQDAQAQQLKEAQLLASYGDFSLFANLYGQDAAAQMSALWTAQNPDLAYRTGRISAGQYYQMTGQYPQGYTAPTSGGGGGGYRGGGGSGGSSGGGNAGSGGSGGDNPLYGADGTVLRLPTAKDGLSDEEFAKALSAYTGQQYGPARTLDANGYPVGTLSSTRDIISGATGFIPTRETTYYNDDGTADVVTASVSPSEFNREGYMNAVKDYYLAKDVGGMVDASGRWVPFDQMSMPSAEDYYVASTPVVDAVAGAVGSPAAATKSVNDEAKKKTSPSTKSTSSRGAQR